ncbi:L,D-transpeptidase family protein [Xanthomonas nasturtii]|uniref:L,D-transpeptidase family protein n=1 Tax=Xanthomonas nasturtii TaxID=1843581 RepID=UPI0020130AD2|nr:L,D-transpeptidase family protein [Xanthomonas nasturtii]MCL1499581.1 L,D-transpeptidase family protein [Xanthomonas nasturtii]MCL1503198.1 L,D-transpeptidase family protein [Xanthomonas nasturtii]MCL1523129.1 L,D-transpeptidase family protein [Xanthomonas nasturtii]MCL1526461.1 L,D-transpeptidase family protein [Xanthomonas nasturtii]MCL1534076.1 L,D-transpeptidase family protein [Xanthomonas nasturtii]
MRLATVFRSLVLLALAGCSSLAVAAGPIDALNQARALIVVTTPDWNSTQARLQAFKRVDGEWQPAAASFAVALGRHGSAWGEGLHPAQTQGPQKREGDGRSPAGVFAIGPAFGYAPSIDSAMPYQPMSATHYCMDVPSSPLYNRIVDATQVGEAAVAGSTEPMRLDLRHAGDARYSEGLVIAHNPKAIPGRGSCIFAHLWRTPGQFTAGCTAMAAADMQRLLAWLKPDDHPLFVLLPRAEYARLHAAWQLPALTEDAQ